MHRVQKLISNYGYCSRRKAETLIEEGRVKVNGKLITIGDKADETDKITIDDKLINKEKKRYIMFHKPIDCVTALTDERLKTIMDYINIKERIFSIGRLDYKTEGLLLLTNDGDFANEIAHPSHEINKAYLAGLGDEIKEEQIKQIKRGIMLEDGKTAPAIVKKIDERHIEITIHEGKNRIIRRMLKALNLRVRFLKRVRIGKLNLGNLKVGEYRELTEKEKELIFS